MHAESFLLLEKNPCTDKTDFKSFLSIVVFKYKSITGDIKIYFQSLKFKNVHKMDNFVFKKLFSGFMMIRLSPFERKYDKTSNFFLFLLELCRAKLCRV